MKSCRECVHGKARESNFVRCDFPLPTWVFRILLDPSNGAADYVHTSDAVDCLTYQPREERETTP